jgi:hypothetical protein
MNDYMEKSSLSGNPTTYVSYVSVSDDANVPAR